MLNLNTGISFIINKKIVIKKNLNNQLYIINNKRFFVIKFKDNFFKYFYIPDFISLEKNESEIFLINNSKIYDHILYFNNIYFSIVKLNNNSMRLLKKKLILKGLGFRMNYSLDENLLELKLGYSHKVFLNFKKLPFYITLIKNRMVIQGIDSVELGNMANKLKNLKTLNMYNGKGFWFKEQKVKLKQVKKK